MASYNKVLLMGNLTRDIELRTTPGNKTVAQIGLAVNHRWRTPEGEQREETTFVDCEAWGKTAEVMQKYLRKGKPVFVEGRLKLDQWEDKEGGKRSKMKVVVEGFQFIDSRGGGGGGDAGDGDGGYASSRPAAGASRSGATQRQPDGGQGIHEPISEDDIPF